MDHHSFIQQSFHLAIQAKNNGNHPFGALLVIDNQVVETAENTVNSSGDVTCHAELNLVKKSQQSLSSSQLKQSILYTSTEPCAMCCGAIYWAGIRTVVYGCSADALRNIAGESLIIKANEIFKGAKESVALIGPIDEETGAQIHKGYW